MFGNTARQLFQAEDVVPGQPSRSEYERLLAENVRLKQKQAGTDPVLLAEILALRRRNAELQERVSGGTSSATPAPVSQPLTSRSSSAGQRFKIKSWDNERRAEEPAPEATSSVGLGHGDDAATKDGSEAPRPRGWIRCHSLLADLGSGGPDDASALLADHLADDGSSFCEKLLSGDDEGAQEILERAFARHLEDVTTPYLQFSSLIPLMFILLRESQEQRGETCGEVGEGGEGLSTPTWYALKRCGRLVRKLLHATALENSTMRQDNSRAQQQGPRRREGQSRRCFVREVCSRVGLTLDLARVAFAQRKVRRRKSKPPTLTLATPARRRPRSCSPESSRPDGSDVGLGASPNASEEMNSQDTIRAGEARHAAEEQDIPGTVEKEELQLLLTQAGSYLSAVQMDMERLMDELECELQPSSTSATNAVAQRATPIPLQDGDCASADAQADANAIGGTDTLESCRASESKVENLKVEPDAEKEPLEEANGFAGTLDASASARKDASSSVPEMHPNMQPKQNQVSKACENEDAELGSKPKTEAPTEEGLMLVAYSDCKPDESAVVTPISSHISGVSAANGDSSMSRDPLIFPTFGEFLQKQLLPLYIADIPFQSIRHLSERYCGAPMESDDEYQAWKTLGMPRARPKSAEAPRRRAAQRRSVLADAREIASTVAESAAIVAAAEAAYETPPREPDALLANLSRPVRPGATMRPQMLSSTAEKKRTGRFGFRDMEVVSGPKPSSTSSIPARGASDSARERTKTNTAAAKAVKPRLAAVFQTPKPERRLSEVDGAALPKPSPVSTQGQRLDLCPDTTRQRSKRFKPSWELLGETPS